MANLDATLDLPEFLDLILDYISTVLPPPVYNIVEYLLSQVYTLLCSLLTLALSLSRSIINDTGGGNILQRLERWWDSLDATEIIPPLVILLAAYLALMSFYRTSKWMISIVIAFVKWGSLLIILGTAAGWYLSNASVGGAEREGIARQWGVTRAVGELIDEFLDSQARKSSTNSESQSIGQMWTGGGDWWHTLLGTGGERETRRQRRERRAELTLQ